MLKKIFLTLNIKKLRIFQNSLEEWPIYNSKIDVVIINSIFYDYTKSRSIIFFGT